MVIYIRSVGLAVGEQQCRNSAQNSYDSLVLNSEPNYKKEVYFLRYSPT
jgi:hypothetical protein